MFDPELKNKAEEYVKEHPELSEQIYRIVLMQYTKNDAIARIEDAYDEITKEDRDGIAEIVAKRYTYDGDYDCTFDYWTNLDNLIEEAAHLL